MADRAIQMKVRNQDGTIDNVYPITRNRSHLSLIVGAEQSGWTLSDCDYVCTGVNDQLIINQAIQALPDGGGEIILLSGDYNISGIIDLNKSSTILRGMGPSTILRREWDGAIPTGIIKVSSTTGTTIQDLYFDSQSEVYEYEENYDIFIENSERVRIFNNSLPRAKVGIYGLDIHHSHIYENVARDGDFGIILENSEDNEIMRNTVYRGEGEMEDYDANQGTILLKGFGNHNNIVAANICLGWVPATDGGINNIITSNEDSGTTLWEDFLL